jgi:cell fate (sporulation/competence/biofilm development) regulator YlbF (YheA/YmcA/DUF963 family)
LEVSFLLATMEQLEILSQSEELARMIIDSEIVEQYILARKKMLSNKETQKKIQHFVQLKELYEDVQRYGKYHPDYKEIMTKVRLAKREMDLDDHVAEFRRAENDLQTLLDEISLIIGKSVSEHVKVPTGNPFFESSCSGGCGSGGSCGCSTH